MVVLGALGCGAWKNNPEDVAGAFADVLERHDGAFKSVIFAIKSKCDGYITSSHGRRPDNLGVFRRRFDKTRTAIEHGSMFLQHM